MEPLGCGGIYIKADIASTISGSRKFRDDIRKRKVQVSRKLYATHVVKISVFRKSRVKFREGSAIAAR